MKYEPNIKFLKYSYLRSNTYYVHVFVLERLWDKVLVKQHDYDYKIARIDGYYVNGNLVEVEFYDATNNRLSINYLIVNRSKDGHPVALYEYV